MVKYPKAQPSSLPDNALAKKALEEIGRIDRESQAKKLGQIEALQSAKAAIGERIHELEHQLATIAAAIGKITGKPVHTERRERRDLTSDRERVGRWMEGHPGEKFGAGDLVREFLELEGTPISIFLKPLIASGKVKTDGSEGIRRTKYYVEG